MQKAYTALAAEFTIGEEIADAIIVTIQLKGPAGVDLQVRASVLAYLSDDAYGDSVVATEPSGAVAIGTDGLLIPILTGVSASELAKTIFQLTSEADGDIDISITEAGAKTLYLVLVMPDGRLVVSDAIIFAA